MATDSSETADSMFGSSSLLETDEPSANETCHRGDAVPLVVESPATFHAFLATSCHKSTPLAVKKLLERSVTNSADVSGDLSWSSSLATPSLIEVAERTDAAERHVPTTVTCVAKDGTADVAVRTKSGTTSFDCQADPAMCISSPSRSTPGGDATFVNLTEDILSGFMCTPPSHKHKQGVIRRRLHAITTNRPSRDDHTAELDHWLIDEPRGSSERLIQHESIACVPASAEASAPDLTLDLYSHVASVRVAEMDATSAMAKAYSPALTRKRSSPLIDHQGADVGTSVATGTETAAVISQFCQGSELDHCVMTSEQCTTSLMAKRRKFRYPRPTPRAASTQTASAHSSFMIQASKGAPSSTSGSVLPGVQAVPIVTTADAVLQETLCSPLQQQAAVCRGTEAADAKSRLPLLQQAVICRGKEAADAQSASMHTVVQLPHISYSAKCTDRDVNCISSPPAHADSQCEQAAADSRKCSHVIDEEESMTTTLSCLHRDVRNDDEAGTVNVLKMSPVRVPSSFHDTNQDEHSNHDAVVAAHPVALSLPAPICRIHTTTLDAGRERESVASSHICQRHLLIAGVDVAGSRSASAICCTVQGFPADDPAVTSTCTDVDLLLVNGETTTPASCPVRRLSHDLATGVMHLDHECCPQSGGQTDLLYADAVSVAKSQRDIAEILQSDSEISTHISSPVEVPIDGTRLTLGRDFQQDTDAAFKRWSCATKSTLEISNHTDPLSRDSTFDIGRHNPVTTLPGLLAFTTASGNPVAVSQSSLRRVKSLFEVNHCPALESVSSCAVTAQPATEIQAQCHGPDLQLCKSSESTNLLADLNRVVPQLPRRKGEATLGESCVSSENFMETRSSLHFFGTAMESSAQNSDAIHVEKSRGTSVLATVQHSDALGFERRSRMEVLAKPPQLQCGFFTASGKQVTVSSEVLQKARALLSDPQSDMNTDSVCNSSIVLEQNTVLRSAATSVGTQCENDGDRAVPRATMVHEPQFSGRVNASASSVRFAEHNRPASANHELTVDGLPSRKRILATSTSERSGGVESSIDQRDNPKCKSSCPVGFSTASGKHVRVSEEAIRKAKVVLETVNTLPELQTGAKDGRFDCAASSTIPSPRIGFSTASGRRVEVSHEAIKQAKQLLDTIHDDPYVNAHDRETDRITPSDSSDTTPCLTAKGFQTAAGKCVAVSSEALSKARALLAETDVSGPVLSANKLINKASSAVSGFKTASGKHMAVSEDTLADVRSVSAQANSSNAVNVAAFQVHVKQAPKPEVATDSTLQLLNTATTEAPVCNALQDYETNVTGCEEMSMSVATALECSSVTGVDGSNATARQLPAQSCDSIRGIKTPKTAGFGPSTPHRPAARLTDERSTPGLDGARRSAQQRFSFGNKAFTPHTPSSVSRQVLRSKSAMKPLGYRQHVDAAVSLKDAMPKKQVLASKLDAGSSLVDGASVGSKKKTFREAFGTSAPGLLNATQVLNLGVPLSVVEVNFSNAGDFVFYVNNKCIDLALVTSAPVETGALANNQIGKQEIFRDFLRMPGIDPKRATQAWLNNHYRWIIWKLASYERSFPVHFGGTCLTVHEVTQQLQYRYKREIYNCERSCLKKILERDDDAKKRMVLVVTNVWHRENKVGLVLGDGWYSIAAEVDTRLELIIKKKCIKEGTKLCICNAILLGPTDGCDPLEADDTVKLKISANSTRRARWDAKLGFQRCSQPFTVPLCSLYADGGTIGCVKAVIARVYPLQFMEKVENGSVIFRSAAAEDRAARRFQEQQKDLMEKAYQRVCKELGSLPNAAMSSRKISHPAKINLSCLTTGAEIFEAMETSGDPETLQQTLSEEQMEKLLDYQRIMCTKQAAAVEEKVREALRVQSSETMEARNVTPLRRTRIVGCHALDVDSQAHTLLTIWRPTADVDLILHEGTPIKMVGLTATEARGRASSIAFQLSTRRGSLLLPINLREPLLHLVYEPREILSVSELGKMSAPPKYEEVDISGVVVIVENLSVSLQIAVIADKNFSFAVLKFWGGLEALGYNRIVTVGHSICVTNASWHTDNNCAVPSLTVTELSTVRELEGKSTGLVSAEFLDESLRRFGTVRDCLYKSKAPGENNGRAQATAKQQQLVGTDRTNSVARCRTPPCSQTVSRSVNVGSQGEPLRMTNGAVSLVSITASDVNPTARKVSVEVGCASHDDSWDDVQFSQIPDSVLSEMDQLEQTCLMLSRVPTAEGDACGDMCKRNNTV